MTALAVAAALGAAIAVPVALAVAVWRDDRRLDDKLAAMRDAPIRLYRLEAAATKRRPFDWSIDDDEAGA